MLCYVVLCQVTVTFTSPGDVSDFDAADQATVKSIAEHNIS
jgi:hypothetical protein